MKSRTTRQFRDLLAALPEQVQEQARTAYKQFLEDPRYPSLQFKKSALGITHLLRPN